MEVTRAGGALGIPGLYVTGDPGAVDDAAKHGTLGIRIGLGWAKSHSFATGQCPVMKYNRALMQCILHDKIKIAKAVNVTTIKLEDARSEPTIKFASAGSDRLDPGQEASESLDVDFPVAALTAATLKAIHLDLVYLPAPYREETARFGVAIGAK